jgi:enterochelin esterase-like enzyme
VKETVIASFSRHFFSRMFSRCLLVILLSLPFHAVISQQKAAQGHGGFGPVALAKALGEAGDDAARKELSSKVVRIFGKQNLLKGNPGVRVEGTSAAWAIMVKDPARVLREDGSLIGDMVRLNDEGLQALAVELPNFSDVAYRIEAGNMTKVMGAAHIEHFEYTKDSQPRAGVPKGRLERFSWNQSRVFPETLREVTVYVPAQYKPGEEAALMVWQDGSRHADPTGSMRVPVVFDNLIHQGDMPVTIAVFIDPGRRPTQKAEDKPGNRSFEYDSLGDAYAGFLLDEILPEVERRFPVKFSADPAKRAIAGGSSGGICAFTAAWERPDQFGKVLSWVGSFVNLRGGHVYPYLLRITERKPIRVYLQDGENDLDNPFGNWPLANKQMAASLKYMGYDFRIDWNQGFHGSKGMAPLLPEALRWLWRE